MILIVAVPELFYCFWVSFLHENLMNLTPFDSNDLDDFFIAGRSWKDFRSEYEKVGVSCDANLWIGPADLNRLLAAGGVAALTLGDNVVATCGEAQGCEPVKVEATEQTFFVIHIWDLLKVSEQFIGAMQTSLIKGQVHDRAVIDGQVTIGEGTKLLPGVYIEGNATIGKNCKIGPNCYIRGNTSIGDGCHIGNAVEIKNSIIGNGSNVGHLSYIGDSILGHQVNLGSGTTTSNFRHDGKNHRSMVAGKLVDTGRRKFGAIIANNVNTGINSSIYPGRKLGKNVTTLPGEVISIDKI